MKKSLIKNIEVYCNSTEFPGAVYFSDIVPDARYKGYKYFFKYHGTHNVAKAFKTQNEIESFIEENMQIDLIECDGNIIKVNGSYLNGVSNIFEIKEVRECHGDKLEVTYKDDKTVYYSNFHGTWGFPTVFA